MDHNPAEIDLAELTARAGVSARTVRYYIQQGLLPAPESRGPGAHYTAEHLDRLLLIRRLQREHLPLAEIRRRLAGLSAEDIRRLAAEPAEREPSDARDYIRDLLSGGAAMMSRVESVREPSSRLRASEPAMDSVMSMLAPMEPPRGASKKRHDSERGDAPGQRRSRWDRIELAPDVEVHVRRPLTREQNRQLELLLEAARTIFAEVLP